MSIGTVPIFGLGFSSKSSTVTSQKLINLYRELQKEGDKSQMTLYGTPGLSEFADLGAAPVRGFRSIGTTLYVVAGGSFYSVNNAGDEVLLGALLTNNGLVSMSDNGVEIIIVDGTVNRYVYDVTTSTYTSTVGDWALDTVDFLAGRFVASESDSGRFRASNLYDGLTWDELDFWTAETNPDNLVAVRCDGGRLYLLGERTTEIWAPTGDSAIFSWTGQAVDWGLAARWSVAKFADSLAFLGKNRLGETQVISFASGSVQRTSESDPEVTHDINTRLSVAGAVAFSYNLDAHAFYQLNFTDKSYLYDAQSQSWSEVSSASGRHFGELRTELLSRPLVTDYRSGLIYRQDKDAYTDNGEAIIREVVTRHTFNNFDRLSVPELYVDMETGTADDAQVMLQISKDNGHTWGPELWRGLGAIGNYGRRVRWLMLGLFRDAVFRLRISDPVKVVITAAAMRLAK
jgi:hypothetical protein